MHSRILFLLYILLLSFTEIISQNAIIKGRVLDFNDEPLFGAAVQLKSSSAGTTTNIDGSFSLTSTNGLHQISFSHLGFLTVNREIQVNDDLFEIDIQLRQDILEMEEVIVSANFNEKSKLESSVSVSTLKSKDIQALAPVSALEVLKTVPGIYINDANGEVGVEIQGRGLSTPYFSLQEDGLPSSVSEMASNEKFTRDMFLRTDITTQRVEAVRGGSASIIAANAPGGVINYISRTGGDDFELEFRNKFGLQANQEEVYNKAELFLGGPVGKTGWNYGIGGHLRYDGGNRVSKFPHSQGGQLKFNVHRFLNNDLSIKIFGKYLDDRVGFNRPTLVTDWNDIKPAPGFDFDRNVVLPDVAFSMLDGFRIKDDPRAFNQIRSRDQQNVQDKSIGLSLQYRINDNWRLKLVSRYANKALIVNHIAEEGGMASIDPNGLFARLFSNFNLYFSDLAPMTLGRFQFYDLQTNENLAIINTEPITRGRPPVVLENNLPGTGEIFWALVDNDVLNIKEYINQLILHGTIQNHNFSFGGYYSLAKNQRRLNAASTFLTIEEEPRLLGTRVDMADFATLSRFLPDLLPVKDIGNQTAVFNDPTGLHGYNSQVNEYNDLDERVISLFASDEWNVTERINVDVGIRYEVINHNGRSGITELMDLQNETGGLDGNILTVHDNIFEGFGGQYHTLDVNYDGLSYSAGINYKIDNNAAVYGRYSHSEKLIDALYLQASFVNSEPQSFRPRQVSQAEVGFKYTGERFGLFAVGYRSSENNIFNQLLVISLTTPEGFYLTPPLLNSVLYYGAEMELNIAPTSWWTLRNILNISGGTNQDFKVWNTGPSDSPGDDILVDLSGEAIAGSTSNKFDLSPIDITSNFSFNKKKGSLLINYRRFAERFANIQQAFRLPGFSLWKLGIAYQLNKNINASVNVNNVFNEIGLLRFNGTDDVAGFPENVTQDFIERNPDKWFKVQRSQGRAFYFSVAYSIK
jgi:outer membrane receptor protein involved in Fe transport